MKKSSKSDARFRRYRLKRPFSANKTQYDLFPERVKIQRCLVQNFSKIQRLKIIGGFLTFWGLKYPQGVPTLLGVKITSNMNSASSNYSECKFSAKSGNLKKITIIGGGIFNIFGAKKAPPQGGTRIF